jgi:hypothetical protein
MIFCKERYCFRIARDKNQCWKHRALKYEAALCEIGNITYDAVYSVYHLDYLYRIGACFLEAFK